MAPFPQAPDRVPWADLVVVTEVDHLRAPDLRVSDRPSAGRGRDHDGGLEGRMIGRQVSARGDDHERRGLVERQRGARPAIRVGAGGERPLRRPGTGVLPEGPGAHDDGVGHRAQERHHESIGGSAAADRGRRHLHARDRGDAVDRGHEVRVDDLLGEVERPAVRGLQLGRQLHAAAAPRSRTEPRAGCRGQSLTRCATVRNSRRISGSRS